MFLFKKGTYSDIKKAVTTLNQMTRDNVIPDNFKT